MGDTGDVSVHVDLSTGMVAVGVRPPFGLESSRVTAPISILDFLDRAAELTLAINKAQREAIAQLEEDRAGMRRGLSS
jgi:hypothetical protein